MYIINKTLNPDIFQGKYKRSSYFEGWYYKLINKTQASAFAVIPGISYGKNGEDSHAFIQVIDAISNKTYYFRFETDDFKASEKSFEIQIGDSLFNAHSINLRLENSEIAIYGHLEFENCIAFPKSFLNPGIMGPFSFLPFMECYHGILNIHHDIKGSLYINSTEIDFSGGYGYLEKDWGKSFPKSWVWLQCNHFKGSKLSVMFSAARIPILNNAFVGFISFIKVGDRLYRFATYTGAKLTELRRYDDLLAIEVKDSSYTLKIKAKNFEGGILKAPQNGKMSRQIIESISANIELELWQGNSLIIKDSGFNCGLEIEGELKK